MVLENEAGFVVSFGEGPWHSLAYVRASHARVWPRTDDHIVTMSMEEIAPKIAQDFAWGTIDMYHGLVVKRVLEDIANRRDAARSFGMNLHIEAIDGSMFPDPT